MSFTGSMQESFREGKKTSLDLVVLSPGVPTDLPIVKDAFMSRTSGLGRSRTCLSESGKGDVLAITGTNGKTTTTALLGKSCRRMHADLFVVEILELHILPSTGDDRRYYHSCRDQQFPAGNHSWILHQRSVQS